VELYILDPLNRRQYVIDQFISLIWTERWQTVGDFQLNIFSTYQTRSLLKPDTWLAMNRSNYVMRIESVEDDQNSDGSAVLVIKGRSIEAILLDRAAKESMVDLTTSPQWTLTNPPATVARTIFHSICVLGVLDPGDIIVGVVEGTFMAASTIAEPTDPITLNLTPTTVYDAISTKICITWELGLRLLRQDSTGQLYFDVYAGSDRTTAQTILPPVVFAPQLDNLQNTKELTTIDTAKNVAYVFSPAGSAIVYASGVDPTVDAFERRVLVVDASDITDPTGISAALTQRGAQALAAARTNFLFDGEVTAQSQYSYGTDYNLGDLIEQQNIDGVATDMRVTEQIFTQDATGEKSYPTLVSSVVINSGSWLSWNNDKAWFDLDADTTNVWGNQP
jgi:hypothetical protein